MILVVNVKMCENAKLFVTKVLEKLKGTGSNLIRSEVEYNTVMEEVRAAMVQQHKTSLDRRRLKKYQIFRVNGCEKLVMANMGESVKYFMHLEEMYEIIEDAHVKTGHGGKHRIEHHLKQKYSNVNREAILIFLSLCKTCHEKRSSSKRGIVVKPMIFTDTLARGQVDLIDMQSCKSDDFKFILNYQDHLSKFIVLKALTTKTAVEVAHKLLDIFCLLGTPTVLQSDNSKEFVNGVLNELIVLWPETRIAHGKPRHSQSQGSVERANRDVQDLLYAWMKDNKTNKWHEGLRFVQFKEKHLTSLRNKTNTL